MPRILRPPYDDPAVHRFQDQLRDQTNFTRMVVRERVPSLQPQEGELIRDGSTLLIYLAGEYRQVYPPVQDGGGSEVPDYILAQWQLLQDELELVQIPPEEWPYFSHG